MNKLFFFISILNGLKTFFFINDNGIQTSPNDDIKHNFLHKLNYKTSIKKEKNYLR